MSLLTFKDFVPAKPTASGKTAPAKVKGADGNTYALGKSVDAGLILAAVASGEPLEVDTSSKQNGQYLNWYLNSAKRVVTSTKGGAEAAPPPAAAISAPSPQHQGATVVAPIKTAVTPVSLVAPAPPHDRDRLIVRQSALKAAVELARVAALDDINDVLATADLFVRWVFKEEAYRNGAEHVGAGGSVGELTTPAPYFPATHEPNMEHHVQRQATPAAQHLAEARQKAVDRRADYEDADAVCPKCGYKEALNQGKNGFFCSKQQGGCGYPPMGERLDVPMSYGEWRQKNGSIRRPDAPVVGPATHASRARED